MLTLYQDVEISDIAYFQEFSRNPYFTGGKAGLHRFQTICRCCYREPKNAIICTMKKALLLVSVLLAMTSAMSQGLGRLNLARRKNAQLLEPLLPFSEAVEKAKSGNAQGWYALAIHYAKGKEIDQDSEKASQFMQKASDMNYSNAVFVAAMLLEADCETPVRPHVTFASGREIPPIDRYVGVNLPLNRTPQHSLTNTADIAAIRTGYERAFSLGVSVATNELAWFERRISLDQEKIKKDAAEMKRKAENAKLAEGLLIDSAPPKKQ